MHGHDVGIWVCEGSGISLGPVLFMQAVLPDPPPRPLLVKWKGAAPPPKAFKKNSALPLIYSECGRLPAWPYYVHLFAPQAPVAQAVQHTTSLQDWMWTVPVIGIVLIFDEKYDRPPSSLSLDRLVNRSQSPKPHTPLAWVQAQQVPYVIATIGYDDTPAAQQQFRDHYSLPDQVPIVPGPPLIDLRRKSASSDNGMFGSVFVHQELGIDRDYAKSVLDHLFKQVDRLGVS